MTVEMVAVAAPSLVSRFGMPECPADLARWPHVHDADRKGWSLWLQTNGIDEVRAPRGPSFDDAGLLFSAVLTGQGAGLLPAAMVAKELDCGQLIRLAEATRMEGFAYYLVCPQDTQGLPKIVAFREWILGHIAQ